LVAALGFEPVDVGPPMQACDLEPSAVLRIRMAYRFGQGQISASAWCAGKHREQRSHNRAPATSVARSRTLAPLPIKAVRRLRDARRSRRETALPNRNGFQKCPLGHTDGAGRLGPGTSEPASNGARELDILFGSLLCVWLALKQATPRLKAGAFGSLHHDVWTIATRTSRLAYCSPKGADSTRLRSASLMVLSSGLSAGTGNHDFKEPVRV